MHGHGADRELSAKDRIVIDPKVLVGKPIIKGTRLRVESIVDLLTQEWTVEDIRGSYPDLQREDVLACLEYAR